MQPIQYWFISITHHIMVTYQYRNIIFIHCCDQQQINKNLFKTPALINQILPGGILLWYNISRCNRQILEECPY